MKTSFKVLHEKALQITKSYLKAESDLISVLQEIDDCRGYREIGFKSLFDYATQGLGLSESVSFNLIAIARKSREIPKLQEMLQKQEITLSNARMIAPVLTSENQDRWLASAAELSKRELEKEIAREFPEKSIQERTRHVSENRIELKLGISDEVHQFLKRAQDLVSSQTSKVASLEETLQAALELYIEKKDPQKRAERSQIKVELGTAQMDPNFTRLKSPVPGQVKSAVSPNTRLARQSSRFIPARLEHAVRLRDQGRCTHQTPQGARCTERRWLDIHHVKSLADGGETTLDNLALVCRGHHQVIHHSPRQLSRRLTRSTSQQLSIFRAS